jgi:hypothetical protein
MLTSLLVSGQNLIPDLDYLSSFSLEYQFLLFFQVVHPCVCLMRSYCIPAAIAGYT